MNDIEIVMDYIENQQECEWVDFKEKFYIIKHNKDCFIKDIVSFANNLHPKDKYIIFGVEGKSQCVCGISADAIPDISTLENLLFEKVEPQISIMLGSFTIDNKLIAFIKIPCSNQNLPYVIKNECGSARQGDIYIRKDQLMLEQLDEI